MFRRSSSHYLYYDNLAANLFFNFALCTLKLIDSGVIILSISFHDKSELRRQQEVDEDRGGRRKKQEESDRGMIKITKKVISVRGAHNQQDIYHRSCQN